MLHWYYPLQDTWRLISLPWGLVCTKWLASQERSKDGEKSRGPARGIWQTWPKPRDRGYHHQAMLSLIGQTLSNEKDTSHTTEGNESTIPLCGTLPKSHCPSLSLLENTRKPQTEAPHIHNVVKCCPCHKAVPSATAPHYSCNGQKCGSSCHCRKAGSLTTDVAWHPLPQSRKPAKTNRLSQIRGNTQDPGPD